VRDAETACAVVEAGADAIGLVFVSASPRHVTVSQAREVIGALPAFVDPVALFVDAAVHHIRDIVDDLGIHTVQLHGHETPEVAAALAPRSVIKAIAFHDDEEQGVLKRWRLPPANVSAMLIDAPPPSGDALPGGGGRTLDWQRLTRWQTRTAPTGLPPLILAGGLTPENVGEAITRVRPYAVDVSSGVESSRGVKDVGKIQAFVEAVRQVDTKIAQH